MLGAKTIFSNTKVQLHMALEVILRLDMAQQKKRVLYADERDLKKDSKEECLV